MDREWLREQLEAWRSMEAIAREVGRSPSTVAYWLDKHGLVSQHAERHRARGPIPEDVLRSLVVAGHSIRRIAENLGRSYSSVRHWLVRYGIETPARSRWRRRPARASRVSTRRSRRTRPTAGRGTSGADRARSAARCAGRRPSRAIAGR